MNLAANISCVGGFAEIIQRSDGTAVCTTVTTHSHLSITSFVSGLVHFRAHGNELQQKCRVVQK